MPNEGAPCDLPSGTHCIETLPTYGNCPLDAVCSQGAWSWTQGHSCLSCAAPDTPIATPLGMRAIASLVVGDLVYSVDHDAVVSVPILRIGRTAVSHHRVVRVKLAGGGVLSISAGHPTADGRTFGDLTAGTLLDGRAIESVAMVPYEHRYTYDILPDSDTETYFAAGVRIGSTLERAQATSPR